MSRDESVRRLGLEFLIVVLGVLVALAVDEFRESRREASLASFYLEGLVADLANDSAGLAEGAARAADQSEAARLLYETVAGKQASSDSAALTRAIHAIGGVVDPPLNDGTYRDLVSSGNLRLIADPDLRRAITSYYSLAATAATWNGDTFGSFVASLPDGMLLSQWGEETAAFFRSTVGNGGPQGPPRFSSAALLQALGRDRDASQRWLRRYELSTSVTGVYCATQLAQTARVLRMVRAAQ